MFDPKTRNTSNEKGGVKEGISVSPETMELVKGFLDQADHFIRSARNLLSQEVLRDKAQDLQQSFSEDKPDESQSNPDDESATKQDTTQIIEGVFEGEQMVAKDGRYYPVPPNYASKSKLVAGDILKLSISPDGTFIFKQIGPISRRKLIGVLEEEDGKYSVLTNGRRYQVLKASVTYFKAKSNDQVTIIIPRDLDATWAAMENVLRD